MENNYKILLYQLIVMEKYLIPMFLFFFTL